MWFENIWNTTVLVAPDERFGSWSHHRGLFVVAKKSRPSKGTFGSFLSMLCPWRNKPGRF